MSFNIDSHCHLDFFDDRHLDKIIKKSNNFDVKAFVLPTVKTSNFTRALNICKKYKNIFISLGVHPFYKDEIFSADYFAKIIDKNNVYAVGECGLDKRYDNFNKQIEIFENQLLIAKQFDLPVIIHSVKSHNEILSLLKKHKIYKGVIHSFNSSFDVASKYLDLNINLGINTYISYPVNKKLCSLIKSVPLASILVETDAPSKTMYLSPEQKSSPFMVKEIVQIISNIKNMSYIDTSNIIFNNTIDLFNIKISSS